MLWYWAVSIDRNRHRYGYKKTQRLAMERATQEVCDLIGWYPVIDETEEINIRDIA